MTPDTSRVHKARNFFTRNWKRLIAFVSAPFLLPLVGILLDASYQSGSRSEPTDIRFQPLQGVPTAVAYEQSTACNEQRVRELMGDKQRRSGIDACAELAKINQKNQAGGGRLRAIFTNKGPEVIENLTAELVLVLNDGQVLSQKNMREAMGVDEYEHIVILAERGFVSRATLCLTFDQPWGRRRNLVYGLSNHERSPTMDYLFGNEQKFQLRRTKGFFPWSFNQFSAPECSA